MNDEIILRKQAIAFHLQGKSKKDIALLLGKSRQWVYKWINRYSSIGGDSWYNSKSTAPKKVKNRTLKEIEELVLSIRKGLEDKKYAQKGALSILYEFKQLGVNPPSIATINRILKRNGQVSKDSLRFAKKKNTLVFSP